MRHAICEACFDALLVKAQPLVREPGDPIECCFCPERVRSAQAVDQGVVVLTVATVDPKLVCGEEHGRGLVLIPYMRDGIAWKAVEPGRQRYSGAGKTRREAFRNARIAQRGLGL